MIDITHKATTLRIATATAVVSVSDKATIECIERNEVPKGNVFEMSKAAGLLGIKKTPELLPDCHPLPIESASVDYQVDQLDIHISVTVKTIYKTGVEVEAMHGASIVALNMYDMLKPIDKGIEIKNIRLESKKGGKSDFTKGFIKDLKAAVVVCSDTITAKKKEDKAGKAVATKLESMNVEVLDYCIIPDEVEDIRSKVTEYREQGADMIIFTGGTGLSPRDVTPEALEPLIERDIPGIAEAIRKYGQDRTPYAMLSRSVSGVIGNTIILALPGSTKGAEESIDAIFPALLHVFGILRGARH